MLTLYRAVIPGGRNALNKNQKTIGISAISSMIANRPTSSSYCGRSREVKELAT